MCELHRIQGFNCQLFSQKVSVIDVWYHPKYACCVGTKNMFKVGNREKQEEKLFLELTLINPSRTEPGRSEKSLEPPSVKTKNQV